MRSEDVMPAADWRQIEVLPGGLRLFERNARGWASQWFDGPTTAVADESGATPPDTDDGTLYLYDKNYFYGSRLLAAPPIELGVDGTAIVPVLTPDRQTKFVFVSPAGALILAAKYGMRIVFDGHVEFRVTSRDLAVEAA
jgi:hypothetical protein